MEQSKEKQEIKNTNEQGILNELILLYKIQGHEKNIRLFGDTFFENNQNNFSLFINDKEVQFCDIISKNQIEGNSNIFKVILKEKRHVDDYSYLFFKCNSLYSFTNVDKMNLSHVTNISHLFTECTSLTHLPDISLFFKCYSLTQIPDISKWNTQNVTTLYSLFGDCQSLTEIPDISEWNTGKVTCLGSLFVNCYKLKTLPDLSKWNTESVTDMSNMFYRCKSLKLLPDLSKWNTKKLRDISDMFGKCCSLERVPDISKWNYSTKMGWPFDGCKETLDIPKNFRY